MAFGGEVFEGCCVYSVSFCGVVRVEGGGSEEGRKEGRKEGRDGDEIHYPRVLSLPLSPTYILRPYILTSPEYTSSGD